VKVNGVETRQSATDLAYAAVKHRVLYGEYPGGELITEGEVSAAVGVSRTPVREAFLRLQAEGLLRLYPKRGALVVPVSVRDLEDVMEARLLVETFAVDKLLGPETMSSLDATLFAMISAQEGLLENADLESFAGADRAFHEALVTAAGNEIVAGLYEGLRDRQLRLSLMHARNSPERLRLAVAEHRAIARALRDRDLTAAREAVRVHLSRTGEALRRSPRPML
jgi:DNA-binding GntR family transcriptional regulator